MSVNLTSELLLFLLGTAALASLLVLAVAEWTRRQQDLEMELRWVRRTVLMQQLAVAALIFAVALLWFRGR